MMIFKILGATTALLAAGFWFYSGRIRIPDTKDMNMSGPNSPSGYMKKQSKFSAIAAMFAGFSAVFHAIVLFSEISN